MTPKPLPPVAEAAATLSPRGIACLRALEDEPQTVRQLCRELRRPAPKVARGLQALVDLGAATVVERSAREGSLVGITNRGREILSHAEQPRIA